MKMCRLSWIYLLVVYANLYEDVFFLEYVKGLSIIIF
jgi:hypothetical protein